jgi:hypothetical protein
VGTKAGALALAALSIAGCASLDRESHSVVIRKKAHRYVEPSPVEKAGIAEARAARGRDPDLERALREASGEALPLADLGRRVLVISMDREPFRPFAWCYLHGTDHPQESLIAVAAAPAEYPLAIATHLGTSFVRGLVYGVEGLLALLGIRRIEGPLPPPEDEKRPPK